ncbi:MAG TPA: hypothetical protein VLE46_16835 [Nitrospira sp.]|jgi:chromosome segregation ATPase|nr:hypothetical protein [Nitrospira sp.]
MKCHTPRLFGTVVAFSLALGLAGCDYWPPALQAEIEQLRSETQTLSIEKTQLQAQVTELSKSKQELQGQIDELSRINREKNGMITSLQHQLDTARARMLKAMAPKSPSHRTSTKPTVKAARKPLTKSGTPGAVGVR